jgi:hypothetical protein
MNLVQAFKLSQTPSAGVIVIPTEYLMPSGRPYCSCALISIACGAT